MHACFREMINSSGNESRKIVFTNISIDDGDKPGHTDYRHGTHVAGSLVCHHVEDVGGLIPENEMTAPSYMSKLVFQDIVNESGWSPPDIDLLFSELAKFEGLFIQIRGEMILLLTLLAHMTLMCGVLKIHIH